MSLKVLKDYTGMRIGKVTVLHKSKDRAVRVVATGVEYRPPVSWVCRCECGREWVVPASRITPTTPASCNECADRSIKRKLPPSSQYVKKRHPSYGSWYAMIRRCTSPIHENYPRYGGRGIRVCDAWLDFDQFVKDMGERPPGKTIERIDNDKGYSPDNCTWATPKEQRANQRNSRPKQKR